MGSDRMRSLRYRSLLAVELVLVALVPAGVGLAGGDAQITVMTQNLYLGSGLTDAFTATSGSQLAAAATHDWANVLTTDFPARAAALADEIARARPDVVGLQEVTLWRDQTPGDALTHPAPDAGHVVFDYLAILLRALRDRGVPYEPATTSADADLEFPFRGPSGGLDDLRLTDRDAILVRSDLSRRASNPSQGHYTAQLSQPFVTGPVLSTRSWSSVDYRAGPLTTVRIFNTHLEVADPGTGPIQQEQGNELLARIASSPYPVIAIGDFNAPAGGSTTPTYQELTAALHDAWTRARPGDPGPTCCRAASLADPVGHEQRRIDFVLTSGRWPLAEMTRVGDRPFRTSAPPLWVSDHDGLLARILMPTPSSQFEPKGRHRPIPPRRGQP